MLLPVMEQPKNAVDENQADVLIFGGAAFTGIPERIAGRLPIPAIRPYRTP